MNTPCHYSEGSACLLRPRTDRTTRHRYRILEDGEQIWTGTATDADHAADICFTDENPADELPYTVQRWNGKRWQTEYLF